MIATKYWSSLKGEIARAIKENNKGEITGASLQSILYSIINSVGDNATFAGVANKATIPTEEDKNVFYFASEPGIYPNFDNAVVSENSIGILYRPFAASISWRFTPIYTFEVNTMSNISLIINEDLGAGKGLSSNLRVAGYEEFIKRGYSPMIIRLKPTKNTTGDRLNKKASKKYRYCWARLAPRRVYGDINHITQVPDSGLNIERFKDNFRINGQGILEIVTNDDAYNDIYVPVEAHHLCAFSYYYGADDNVAYIHILNGSKSKNIRVHIIDVNDGSKIITRRLKYGLVFVDWSSVKNPNSHKFEKNEYKSNIVYFDIVITFVVTTDGNMEANCNFSESR